MDSLRRTKTMQCDGVAEVGRVVLEVNSRAFSVNNFRIIRLNNAQGYTQEF